MQLYGVPSRTNLHILFSANFPHIHSVIGGDGVDKKLEQSWNLRRATLQRQSFHTDPSSRSRVQLFAGNSANMPRAQAGSARKASLYTYVLSLETIILWHLLPTPMRAIAHPIHLTHLNRRWSISLDCTHSHSQTHTPHLLHT